MEAQLKLPALSLIEAALPDFLTQAFKNAAPGFHGLPDAIQNTDAYVAANYFLGMRISELERIRTLNAPWRNLPGRLVHQKRYIFFKECALP